MQFVSLTNKDLKFLEPLWAPTQGTIDLLKEGPLSMPIIKTADAGKPDKFPKAIE